VGLNGEGRPPRKKEKKHKEEESKGTKETECRVRGRGLEKGGLEIKIPSENIGGGGVPTKRGRLERVF